MGKFGLNRYGQMCKPAPDQMFVAAAKMGLEPCEVVCISDCARDEVAAKGAGIGCMTIGSFSTEDLIDRVGSNPAPEPDTRDYDSFRVPVMGIIGCIAEDTLEAGMSIIPLPTVTFLSSLRARTPLTTR